MSGFSKTKKWLKNKNRQVSFLLSIFLNLNIVEIANKWI